MTFDGFIALMSVRHCHKRALAGPLDNNRDLRHNTFLSRELLLVVHVQLALLQAFAQAVIPLQRHSIFRSMPYKLMNPYPQAVAAGTNAGTGAPVQAPMRRTMPQLKDYKWSRRGCLVKKTVAKRKVPRRTPSVVNPGGADIHSRQMTLKETLRHTRDQESDLTTAPDDGDGAGRASHTSTPANNSKAHPYVNDGPSIKYLHDHVNDGPVDLRASPWVQPPVAYTEVVRTNEMRRESGKAQLGADEVLDIVLRPVVCMAAGLLTNT